MSFSERATNAELEVVFMRSLLRAMVRTHPQPAQLTEAWLDEIGKSLKEIGITELPLEGPPEHRRAIRLFWEWNGLVHEALARSHQ